jgi:hypothetical protein
MKVGSGPRMSMCKDRDNSLIRNHLLIMKRWKQHFYETLNSKNDMKIREEVIYQGPKGKLNPPTKDKVWEKIRTSKNNKSSGKDNSAELIKYGDKIL